MIVPDTNEEEDAMRVRTEVLTNYDFEAYMLASNIDQMRPQMQPQRHQADNSMSIDGDKGMNFEVPDIQVNLSKASHFSISNSSKEEDENRKTSKFWKEPKSFVNDEPKIEISNLFP